MLFNKVVSYMKKRVLNDTWKVLYNLGEKLGSGGNATVFKVTRKSDGKELPSSYLAGEMENQGVHTPSHSIDSTTKFQSCPKVRGLLGFCQLEIFPDAMHGT